MNCIYIYKGHTFNSEIELDDFLIESQQYESSLGDLVFSLSRSQQPVVNTLNSIIHNTQDLKNKREIWERTEKYTYGEDGEISVNDPPYVGVNAFLAGFTDENGTLLFPEFREDEYWRRRFDRWKRGDFYNPDGTLNEAELAEFGINKDNPVSIPEDQLESRKEQMKKRWKAQADCGTAIHNVMQIVFERTGNKYNFELSDEALFNTVNRCLKRKNLKYLSESIIRYAITHAKKVQSDLVRQFGDGLVYFPEFDIAQDTNTINKKTLFGVIDLLIVDSSGKVHILDYKTSVHSYPEFSQAKKLAYNYQMATYQRMLEKYGINTFQGEMMVAPIQIIGFDKGNDDYKFDKIQAPESFITISTDSRSERMWENINGFMSSPPVVNITGDMINTNTSDWLALCFPQYSSSKTIDEEYVVNFLKKNDILKKNENGNYIFRKYNKEGFITSDNEIDFVKKVTAYLKSQPGKRLRYTGEIKNCLYRAIKNGLNTVEFPSPYDFRLDINSDRNYIKSTFSKYCDGNWEIINNSVLESYGIIMLETKDIPGIPHQIDFIRISTNDLHQHYRKYIDKNNNLTNRKGLTGTFESDVQSQSKNNSLIANAVQGNVELMETTAIISQLTGLEGKIIGNVQIINPTHATGMSMSNEQLLYNFNELNRFAPLKNNRILSGDIKFAKKTELVLQQLNHIMITGEANDWTDEYRYFKRFKSSIPNYDSLINSKKEDQLKELQKLYDTLQTHEGFRKKTSGIYDKQSDLMSIPISVNNAILYAIAQLKGVDFRQQLEDHDKWLESIFIHRNGVSGSYLDNPGNLNSETLNLVTKLVTEAYQNTRDDMQREKTEIYELINALRKEQGFNNANSVIKNQVDLYKDLYEITSNGDFLFKNPTKLPQGAKRKLLEYALDKINKNRFPNIESEELQRMKESGDIRYYRVPLALGGSDSQVSVGNLMQMFKEKLRSLHPSVAWKKAQQKVQGIYDDLYETDDENRKKQKINLFKMSNMFDYGEEDSRLDKIQEIGISNLEHNLETLLLKHIFAYSVQKNMDSVFPMIKAAMVHITSEGAMKNKPFTDDIDYFKDYITNKILNKSIVSEKNEKWVKVASLLKQAASKFTLGFAPVQMFYQPLQGLWQDISLIIRKPDGKNSFTFQHFKNAIAIVGKDLFHFSDKPTLCSLLNQLYGINDMDMNVYVDRISTAKKGIWNFENFLFKFASRPDFYNRMSIFLSQMMGDGCLEAHSVDSKGRLVYDWKKDKRFSKFAANPTLVTSDAEYNKQKSLYYAIASQFVNEHAKMPDGSDFELNMSKPMALPRAYTNKQAESMKSLSDDIYGYYSHEKKSLIMSTAIGSLWLQFKTYWSGKKNQYLQSGGVRLRGEWKHFEQNGEKYYYQVDKQGNILYDQPPTTTETIAPVMQWEGQWQEGILVTLSDMIRSMWDHKSITKGFSEKWDTKDAKLQQVYRSNIKQFGYELVMFCIVGSLLGALLQSWLDNLKKENVKNKDFTTGLYIAAANVAVLSVKNSFLDLNFIESIGGPIGQWTPFAFEWTGRMAKNWYNVAMGDEDFYDGVVKSFGSLKQIKPALDAIKPNMFRTEREGGTFNKKN